MIEVSVVICFRDWGLDRLALALRSHAKSTLGKKLEVIVSDYGSADGELVRKVVERNGGVYARTNSEGPWSRARALNAGIAQARGGVIVTTDADILFTPDAQALIVQNLHADQHSVQLLQCRDLQPDFSADKIAQFNWGEYEANSVLRPRWGMGGMIAFPVPAYEYIRGYDERMEIYGGEDIDFAHRMRRAGYRLNWIDDPCCRIFHVWHESSRKSATETDEGRIAVERNRDIMMHDRTWVRNINWRHSRVKSRPLATVSIATYNRADFLRECINSVLTQTVDDIEVIVVDDGSSDHTGEVMNSFRDSRIRYFRQENKGVSSARNLALAEAMAPFIVIQDDDDLMLPWRIQAHFDALHEGAHGTYGGWVDFDNETGSLVARPGKEFGLAQMLYSGGVMAHGTLMMRTDVLRKFGYNPMLRAGTDFNLALRMTMSGVKLRHTGSFHILRRFHGGNLTNVISDHQKDSARKATNLYRRRFTPAKEAEMRASARTVTFATCRGAETLSNSAAPYLPDNLVNRIASVRTHDATGLEQIKDFSNSHNLDYEVFLAVDEEGALVDRQTSIYGISASQWRELRVLGFDPEIETRQLPEELNTNVELTPQDIVERIVDVMLDRNFFYCVRVAPSESQTAKQIWAEDSGVRRLVVVGRRQFAVAAREFPDLDGAVQFGNSVRSQLPSVDCLILQPTV